MDGGEVEVYGMDGDGWGFDVVRNGHGWRFDVLRNGTWMGMQVWSS